MLMLLAGGTTTGCRQQMADQPHARPLEPSGFFDDGMASRPVPPGTVPRGEEPGELLHPGKIAGKSAEQLPFAVTREVLARGQERYEIYCAPCHDRLGTGQGMVVRRGFPRAHSFHDPRLLEAPASHFFEVMTRGFGAMPSYAEALPPADRRAVIAYIRALQLSRNVRLADLPPEDQEKLRSIK
ncbi:MAG: c-type cytochrome [Deltaproteobacteria bacterium]|nr:c-type cytochrome [Deltaproteobacteria bacterium]